MSDWNTCRFCGKTTHASRMVQYGVRHYAHFACYLDRKSLCDLKPWVVARFPVSLLRERNLIDCAKAVLRGAQ